MIKFIPEGVCMLVSAISSSQNSLPLNPLSYINVKGSDLEILSGFYTPLNTGNTECKECRLYYNINQWKHFCHKQIAAGNLDIVA